MDSLDPPHPSSRSRHQARVAQVTIDPTVDRRNYVNFGSTVRLIPTMIRKKKVSTNRKQGAPCIPKAKDIH